MAQYAGYAVQKMYKCIKCSRYMGLSNRTLKNWWLIICLIIISHIKGSCFATKNVCNPPVWTKIKQPWLWKKRGPGAEDISIMVDLIPSLSQGSPNVSCSSKVWALSSLSHETQKKGWMVIHPRMKLPAEVLWKMGHVNPWIDDHLVLWCFYGNIK